MSRPINVEVRAKYDEPIERLLRRFSKKVKKERITEDYRERMFYEKPSEIRKKERRRRRRLIEIENEKRKNETNYS